MGQAKKRWSWQLERVKSASGTVAPQDFHWPPELGKPHLAGKRILLHIQGQYDWHEGTLRGLMSISVRAERHRHERARPPRDLKIAHTGSTRSNLDPPPPPAFFFPVASRPGPGWWA